MSPAELWREFEAARLRDGDRYNRDVRLAWLAAALGRTPKTKRMPRLESLTQKAGIRPNVRPSLQQQEEAFEQISRQYGIPITETEVTH